MVRCPGRRAWRLMLAHRHGPRRNNDTRYPGRLWRVPRPAAAAPTSPASSPGRAPCTRIGAGTRTAVTRRAREARPVARPVTAAAGRPGRPGRHRPATGPGGPGATALSPGETAASRIWRGLPRSWDASFAGHLLTATGGAAECLGPDHIWVSRAGRKDLKPGSLAPGSWPLYSDVLHGHLLGRSPYMGPGWRGARLCLATGSARDGMSSCCPGRHPEVDMPGGIFGAQP